MHQENRIRKRTARLNQWLHKNINTGILFVIGYDSKERHSLLKPRKIQLRVQLFTRNNKI
jgi:hypothetical protein